MRAETKERHLNNYKVGESGCWEWLGCTDKDGYGRICATENKRKKEWFAHRWFFTQYKTEIPKGLLVCHSCDNPSCVNPDHLWLGTNKDNMIDKVNKGRGYSKLNSRVVKEIREKYSTGNFSQRALAKEYNLSGVSRIIKGEVWKHVT